MPQSSHTPQQDEPTTSGAAPAPVVPAATPATDLPQPQPEHGRHGAAAPGAATSGDAWRTLGRALRPRGTVSQLTAALLCGLLGFALAVQLTADKDDSLAGLRQNELVRVLDEVTRRGNELEKQAATLQEQLAELRASTDDEEALLELVEARAEVQGILSGRLPAEGPGVVLRLTEGTAPLEATVMLTVLEELRNAGAEVIQVNDTRIVASSSFTDSPQGIVLDGTALTSPYVWDVIGDAEALTPALEIPGGAMATVRNAGADGTVTARDTVRVDAVREPPAQRVATPVAPATP